MEVTGTQDDLVQVSFRLPASLLQRLAKIAEREERSVSGQLRHAVQRHVAELETDPPAVIPREELSE